MAEKSPFSISPWQRLFSVGILVLNFGLAGIYIFSWFRALANDLFWKADFTAFYTGWTIVLDGHGNDLYDLGLQSHYQHDILGKERSVSEDFLPFINPPGLALLFTPLANLSLQKAFLVWTIGSLFLLSWLFRLLWKISSGWKILERWLLIGAVLGFYPMMSTFFLGSFSILLLVLFFQIYITTKHRRQELSGLWLFIGSIKPQIMLLPGVMLLSNMSWVAIGVAVFTSALMVVVSSSFLGWHIWLDFLHILQTMGNSFGIYGMDPSVMYNFRGALTTLLGREQASSINLVSTFALVVATISVFLIWRRPWKPEHPEFELPIAATMALSIYFSPHLNPSDGLLYIAPAVLFYMYLLKSGRPHKGFAVFTLLCPLLFIFTEFNLGDQLGVRGPVIAATVLLIWIGKEYVLRFRSNRQAVFGS